jgi:malonyl-CoA O-methyltransferase
MSTLPTLTTAIPDWLSLEIANRMMDKLTVVKLEAEHIFHSGSVQLGLMHKRFPKARHYCSNAKLEHSSIQRLLLQLLKRPSVQFHSTDALRPQHLMDLVWSNLELQHHPQPELLVQSWERLLKPESLLMFAYLGPDTGKELRLMGGASEPIAGAWDMHDVGDALLKSGFAEPVMDMEYITLEYEHLDLLLKDAMELGLVDEKGSDLIKANPELAPLKMTLEVVYGHAWTPERRLSKSHDGVAKIGIDQILRSKQ